MMRSAGDARKEDVKGLMTVRENETGKSGNDRRGSWKRSGRSGLLKNF
jgi:hypothetical protein